MSGNLDYSIIWLQFTKEVGTYICEIIIMQAERNGKGIQPLNYMDIKDLHNLKDYAWTYVQ